MTHYQRTAFGVVFVLVIALCSAYLVGDLTSSTGRLDLTEAKLYTLSQGSKNIVDGLQKPLTMKFFYSKSAVDRTGQDRLREIHTYYNYVRSLLQAFERYGRGKLVLEEYDPRAFSRAEEEADRLGVQRLGNLGDDGLYFGMAVTSGAGAEQAVKFFDPNRQAQIEYQVAEAIDLATKPARRKLGVLSSLDITGGGMSEMMRQMMQMQGRPVSEPWSAIDRLRRFYDVQDVAADTDTIDPTLDYLLVVHPKNLGEQTLYAIDQFVMNGGDLIVFVDPYAPIADQQQQDPSDPFGGRGHNPASDLNRLLEAYGCKTTTKIVGDPNLAMNLPDRRGRSQLLVTFLGLNRPAPSGEQHLGVNEDEVIAQGLGDELWLYYAGAVERSDAAGADFVSLLQTTARGNTFDLNPMALSNPAGPDPQTINRDFSPGVQPVTLAARLNGTFRSAFPDGKPKAAEPETDESDPEAEEPAAEDVPEHIAESREPTTIIVCADVDMLADGVAYRRVGPGLSLPLNANGDFLNNAIDFLAGSTDLMSIRSRGNFERPFLVVEEIEREADRATQDKVEQINADITRFESEIQDLGRSYTEENAGLVKGEAMDKRRELERQVREKRRELNEVQKERNDQIESLGTWLQILNAVIVPFLVLIAGIAVWSWRRHERVVAKGGVA